VNSPIETAADLGLQPLPEDVAALLTQHHAPPRLIAHLIVTHHTAGLLISAFRTQWPALVFDTYLVQMGAALHDIGKLRIRPELVSSGKQHEQAGYELLLETGMDPQIARFARTHSARTSESHMDIEDLLVGMADQCALTRRDRGIEDMMVRRLSARLTEPSWEVFTQLDTILTGINARMPQLVAWQSLYSPD
jgi:putative nucleotidyltransferase with HDIG domain